ncbi:putative RNA methyltransferase [Aliiglaciecola sp. LCG003]|uniref:putative RNA methyltransferase n=1 Tax=Aliiglaciecola sp. LCG003 TaxID=3053655 RepID=UPI002573AB6B|nr:methyltransferase domain-containing protein [Aliiglaciecola sp. LCG003]WJG10981.1 methyltransferase domain-containing protein [Aliiglaciecola sp. LCG003]
MWICPACKQPLLNDNSSWRCEANHVFDKAKQGYVNLQLAQERNSKSPGDSKEMILARRAFFQQGYYAPLAAEIAKIVCMSTDDTAEDIHVFDAGCGEGYYLNTVEQVSTHANMHIAAYGCDISKVAIQQAAKRYPSCEFSVASTFKIPLPDNSMDWVIQVFAPSSEQEIARILKPNGRWIRVNPGPLHLAQLKHLIYQTSQSHGLISAESDFFTTMTRYQLDFKLDFQQPEDRLSLLKMTPFYWRASEGSKAKFEQSTQPCNASFDIHLMRKNP